MLLKIDMKLFHLKIFMQFERKKSKQVVIKAENSI